MKTKVEFSVTLKHYSDAEYSDICQKIENAIMDFSEVASVDVGIGEELGEDE